MHAKFLLPRLGTLLVLTLLAGCSADETPVHTTQFVAFGSAVGLSLVGLRSDDAVATAAEVERDILSMERTWHAWKPGPMVRVNELLATGEPFAAPPSLLPLLRKSQQLALQSDNLFNPAIGQLMALWGFQTDTPECRPPPSRRAIEQLVKARPSIADIAIDGVMIQSDNPAVKLDFNAIAKGYVSDVVMGNLTARGVRNAMINAGGDVRVMGNRAGRPWRVAIHRANGTGVFAVLNLSGEASVYTSGDYQHNFIYGGKVYHHVIDPRTGWPADGIKAVTVLHFGDAATAQAASAALMIAGLEHWHEIAQRMGIRYVMLTDEAGTVHMTPAMAELVELIDSDADITLSEPVAEETGPR